MVTFLSINLHYQQQQCGIFKIQFFIHILQKWKNFFIFIPTWMINKKKVEIVEVFMYI